MSISVVHRMLGELLSGVAIVCLLLALFAKNPGGLRRATGMVLRVLAVVLSVQWVIGIVAYFLLYTQGAVVSLVHPIIMTVVLAAAHIVSGRAKKGRGLNYGALVVASLILAVGILGGIGRLGVKVL